MASDSAECQVSPRRTKNRLTFGQYEKMIFFYRNFFSLSPCVSVDPRGLVRTSVFSFFLRHLSVSSIEHSVSAIGLVPQLSFPFYLHLPTPRSILHLSPLSLPVPLSNTSHHMHVSCNFTPHCMPLRLGMSRWSVRYGTLCSPVANLGDKGRSRGRKQQESDCNITFVTFRSFILFLHPSCVSVVP